VWSFFTPVHNTLIQPGITPPGLLLLAVAGGWLSIRGHPPMREQGMFLVAWLALFYIAHGYALAESAAMQARYHLHLVVPFAMLAALGASRLFARRRAVFWLAAAYVATVPFVHRGFIGDMEFDGLREYAFVRSAAERLPVSCTVLEYTGEGMGEADVRFGRTGALLDGRTERRLSTAIPIGASAGARDPLREEIRVLIATPPSCLYYYEGLFCYGRKEPHQSIADACAEMHRAAELEEVSTTRFMHRVYDGALATGMGERRDPIVLTLFRVVE